MTQAPQSGLPLAAARSADGEQYLVYGQIAEEVNACLHAGREPNVEALLAPYPELAPALREMVGALLLLHQLGQGSVAGTTSVRGEGFALAGRLGDFEIVREIGRGGMGVVYEAVQLSLGRRVALKVLPFAATLDPKQLQRFRNEAQAAAQLHHTNIVPVISVGCERGVHYYAMQYIEGQTLAALIHELRNTKTRKKESPKENQTGVRTSTAGLLSSFEIGQASFHRVVAQLGVQIAEALDHAHQLGVIHRDVKPANLLVDLRRKLWITDFGLAHCQNGPGLTLTGDIVGTLRYMSPEQALGKHAQIDARTDVYSVGVTLYELLTLRPAYDGQTRAAVLQQIAFEEPPPPRRWEKAVPAELETIVLKAMAKSPEERYATAGALAEDLRRFLDDKPIQARRPTLRKRLAKWARRHRGTVTTGVVALLAGLVLGVAGLVWSNVQIRQEQTQTEAARNQAERNLALAMQALEAVFLRWDEEQRWHDPRSDRRDEVFLDRALQLYEQLDQENGRDPRVRQGLALAWDRRGNLWELLGRHEAAAEAYQRSLGLSGELRAADPQAFFPRWIEADSHQGLGRVLSALGAPAAAEHRRLSLELWSRLMAEFPREAACRRGLAHSHIEMARQLLQQGELGRAKDHYQQALALQSQRDAELPGQVVTIHDLAASHQDLANLLRATGQLAEAEMHYRRAIALIGRLAAELPETPRYRACLALSYRALGDLYGPGRAADAEEPYRRALEIQTQLVADFPNLPQHRAALADTHNSAGILAGDRGDLGSAERHFRQALALRSRLAAEQPGVPAHRQAQAGSHLNLGKCFQEGHDAAAAEPHDRQALELLTQLVKECPTDLRSRHDLANAHINLADLLESAGQGDQAEAHARQALELRAKLAADVPQQPEYRRELALAEELLGKRLWAKGEHDSARNHFGRARALWTHLTRPDASTTASDETLHDFACFLANCPDESFRDAEQAVRLARRALEQAPARALHWSTLGMALYRQGESAAALSAFAQAAHYRSGQNPLDGFFQALAHAQLGDEAAAQQSYAQAASFMDRYQPGDEQLRRLRSEGARQWGLGDGALPHPKEDPNPFDD